MLSRRSSSLNLSRSACISSKTVRFQRRASPVAAARARVQAASYRVLGSPERPRTDFGALAAKGAAMTLTLMAM